MAKITVSANCGNSPKMAFISDFRIALAERNVTQLGACITDDFIWHHVGQSEITGRADFEQTVVAMRSTPVSELTIHSVVTHGREAAANGEIVTEDGTRRAFCDMYLFSSTTGKMLRKMTSYVIQL